MKQPGDTAGAAAGRDAQRGEARGVAFVRYFVCIFPKLRQMSLWIGALEDLSPNCFPTLTALQKFTSKYQNAFCFLSAGVFK